MINDKTVYVLVYRKGGMAYTESPEEQGRAEGPNLLRVFSSEQEALRYRDAILEYSGERVTVSSFLPEELWTVAKGVKIELCSMPESEWARPVLKIWEPTELMN